MSDERRDRPVPEPAKPDNPWLSFGLLPGVVILVLGLVGALVVAAQVPCDQSPYGLNYGCLHRMAIAVGVGASAVVTCWALAGRRPWPSWTWLLALGVLLLVLLPTWAWPSAVVVVALVAWSLGRWDRVANLGASVSRRGTRVVLVAGAAASVTMVLAAAAFTGPLGSLTAPVVLPAAALVCTGIGRALGLRWWFAALIQLLVVSLVPGLIWMTVELRWDDVVWFLPAVPWVATAASVPGRADWRRRLGVAVVAPVVAALVVGLAGTLPVGEVHRRAVAIEATGVPLYAPAASRELSFYLRDTGAPGRLGGAVYRTGHYGPYAAVELASGRQECAEGCRRIDAEIVATRSRLGTDVFHRAVPGGEIRYERQGFDPEEEHLEVLRGMEPVSARWLARRVM